MTVYPVVHYKTGGMDPEQGLIADGLTWFHYATMMESLTTQIESAEFAFFWERLSGGRRRSHALKVAAGAEKCRRICGRRGRGAGPDPDVHACPRIRSRLRRTRTVRTRIRGWDAGYCCEFAQSRSGVACQWRVRSGGGPAGQNQSGL